MGIRNSIPSILVTHEIFLDGKRVFEDINLDDLDDMLQQFISELKFKNTEYNCDTYYKNEDDIIHILGTLKNSPVVYDNLLHVIEVVETYNSR
jgi:hypothetical protein